VLCYAWRKRFFGLCATVGFLTFFWRMLFCLFPLVVPPSGLQKALDHGKLVARGGRRCAVMLLEAANCYEQFGVAVMKSCQSSSHLFLENDGDNNNAVKVLLMSLSQQTRQMSTVLRDEIALPMQGYHTSMAETVPAMYQKYEHSRKGAWEARKRAIVTYTKYSKTVDEAERASQAVVASGNEEQPQPTNHSSSSQEGTNEKMATNQQKDNPQQQEQTLEAKRTWDHQLEQYGKTNGPGAVDRVKHLWNDVKVLQKRYESCIEKENNAVKFSHTIESIALEGLQKLHEQRLCLFYDSLLRTFDAIKDAVNNLIIPDDSNATSKIMDESSSTEQQQQQVKIVQHSNNNNNNKKGEFFSTFLKVGGQEKTGLADADTLGLTEDVGKLRDQVQTRLAERLATFKKAKALVSFLDEVSLAAATLGNSLQQVVKHEDSYVNR
jgi:hypothetical protein